jgi:hypothetical protein
VWLRVRDHGEAAAPSRALDAGPRIDYEVTPVEVPSKPEIVTISIDTMPSGATVIVDGDERGVTPLDVRVAKSDKALTVTLKNAGYVPMAQQVVPDKDVRMSVSLSVTKHGTGGGGQKHPPKGAGSGSGFHRFD